MKYDLIRLSSPPSRFGGITNMTECFMQSNLSTKTNLAEKVAVGASFNSIIHLLTPSKKFWNNGMDDKILIEESIQLFNADDDIEKCVREFGCFDYYPQQIIIFSISIEGSNVFLTESDSIFLSDKTALLRSN